MQTYIIATPAMELLTLAPVMPRKGLSTNTSTDAGIYGLAPQIGHNQLQPPSIIASCEEEVVDSAASLGFIPKVCNQVIWPICKKKEKASSKLSI